MLPGCLPLDAPLSPALLIGLAAGGAEAVWSRAGSRDRSVVRGSQCVSDMMAESDSDSPDRLACKIQQYLQQDNRAKVRLIW